MYRACQTIWKAGDDLSRVICSKFINGMSMDKYKVFQFHEESSWVIYHNMESPLLRLDVSPTEFIKRIPPFTGAYILAIVALRICYVWDLFTPSDILFWPKLTWNELQIWRLFLPFIFFRDDYWTIYLVLYLIVVYDPFSCVVNIYIILYLAITVSNIWNLFASQIAGKSFIHLFL